jgi:hypothetical protein
LVVVGLLVMINEVSNTTGVADRWNVLLPC